MKILLIEPDHVLSQIYRLALLGVGHKVQIAKTAQGAISAGDTDMPDLVIVELQLVEHSGIEFLYEFRSYRDWQGIPIIINSQVPPAEFADNELLTSQLGVRTYLYKPQTSLGGLLRAVGQLQPQVA